MNNTKHSPRPNNSTSGRKAQRSGQGCSLAFGAVLIVLIVIVVVLGPRALNLLQGNQAMAVSAVDDRTSPEQLAAKRQKEMTQLSGYGWVNQASGVAHIPIDRAIALVAEKGLPMGNVVTTSSNTTSTAEITATGAPVDLANVSFETNVLPIFQQHCQECHGNDNPEEGLELTNYHTIMAGSQNGTVVEPGVPDNSYLVKMVVTKKMPKKGPPLSATEIDTIIAWIKAGAKDDTGTHPKTPSTQGTTAVTMTTALTSTVLTSTVATTPTTPVDLTNISFKTNVLPIFEQHCSKCHGNDNPEEGLEVTNYRALMVGSNNGSVVEPGDPDKSYLVKMVVEKKMPKKGPPLSSSEIDVITAWIKAGAKDN